MTVTVAVIAFVNMLVITRVDEIDLQQELFVGENFQG